MLVGQANIIFQAHPGFHSPYSGTNSQLARGEYKTSLVGTLYMGYELNANPRYDTDLIYDEESAGGRGISEATYDRAVREGLSSHRCRKGRCNEYRSLGNRCDV